MIDVPLIGNGVYRFEIHIDHYDKDDSIYFGLSSSQIFFCDNIESCDNVCIVNSKTGNTLLNKMKGSADIDSVNKDETITLVYNNNTRTMMYGKSIDRMYGIFNFLPSTLYYPILFFDGNTEVTIISCGYCDELSNLMISDCLAGLNIVTPTKVCIYYYILL